MSFNPSNILANTGHFTPHGNDILSVLKVTNRPYFDTYF